MNLEQIKSLIRWLQATVGPILISHGYVSSGNLEMIAGVLISLAPLIWSMVVHTQTNAVAVVDTLAKKPDSGVKAVVTDNTEAGRTLASAMPGTTTVVEGTAAAVAAGKAA